MRFFGVKSIVAMVLAILATVSFSMPLTADDNNTGTARIGVLAYRGAVSTRQRWQPLANYLSKAIDGWKFVVVPVTLSSAPGQIEDRKIEFLITNPGHYVDLQKSFGLAALATRERLGQKSAPGQLKFGSVVFVRADAGIGSFTDLDGKTLAAVSPDAFGGFQIVWREFVHQGIDPFEKLKSIRFMGFPQDSIITAVRKGTVDAGVVRSGLLELLADEGRISLDEFAIINGNSQMNYPHLVSSRLYPEWPFAGLPSTGKKLREQVVTALMATQNRNIAKAALLNDIWSAPLSYGDVRELINAYQKRGKKLSGLGGRAGGIWNILTVIMSMAALAGLIYVMATRRRRKPVMTGLGTASVPEKDAGLEISVRFDDLTKREREVLCLICQGLSSKVVAGQLGISTKTVEFHRANLLAKTRAGTTPRLVQMATQVGFDKLNSLTAQ